MQQCWKQISAHVDMWAPGSPKSWGEATVVLLGHNTDRTCRQPLPGAAAMRSSRKRCTGTAAGTKVAPVQARAAETARTSEPTRALGLARWMAALAISPSRYRRAPVHGADQPVR